MAKKEINIFTVSFLDLLSGALAAVIILLVIIPRMTSEDQEVIETVNELEVQVQHLDSLIQVAANCIEPETMRQIEEELARMRENLQRAEARANNAQSQLQNARQRNRVLENQLVETETSLREMEEALAEASQRPSEEELEELRNQLAEARAELQSLRESAAEASEGAGGAMFGVDAKFAIVCDWTGNIDVDLFIKNTANNQWICWNCGGDRSWGKYLGDVTSRVEGDGKFEMFYQEDNIMPGNYEVWYHVYTTTGSTNISGYAVIHPFTSREQKIKFSDQRLSHTSRPDSGGGIKIGTLNVTENSLTLNR